MRGFDATSLTSIASAAGLTPSALYHYFDGKEALYGAVVHRTVEVVWDGLLQRVSSGDDLATQVDLYVAEAERYGSDSRLFSSFLIGVPVEAKRNPTFTSLAELLASWQTRVFDHMAETGLRTNELARFGSRSRGQPGPAPPAARVVVRDPLPTDAAGHPSRGGQERGRRLVGLRSIDPVNCRRHQ